MGLKYLDIISIVLVYEVREMSDNIILIISMLIGTIIGMLVLKKYDFFERFAISITTEIVLFAFNFILVYIVLTFASLVKTDIDYNMLFGAGTLLAIIALGPCCCLSINKYMKNKKFRNCICSIFIFIIIYLIILFIISLFL